MKIGLHMIVAGDPSPVIPCIESQSGLCDCGVILVDSKRDSDDLYSALINMNIPHLAIRRYVWESSFARARNTALEKLLLNFPNIDYVYWVDGDDIWAPGTNLSDLRDKLEKEQPEAVNLLYQYSSTAKLYRNRIWKVVNGEVPYFWRGGAHEVEWSKKSVWPTVVNWDDFVILHTRPQEDSPDSQKRERNISFLEKAIKDDPDFHRNYYYLGQELFHNAQYREAIKPLNEYIKLSSNVAEKYQAYLILAQVLYNLKLIERSFQALDEAINIYPDSQFAYSLKGSYLAAQEKWEEAMPYLNKAIEVPGAPVIFDYEDQRTVVPLRWLSVCHEQLGNIEEAQRFHHLANLCRIDDGLRKRNGVWLSSNKYLAKEEPEHFNKTDPELGIDEDSYIIINKFKNTSIKYELLGAMDYNRDMKVIRLLNEGTESESAVVFKGNPNYEQTVPLGEKHALKVSNYKYLFRSEQFSLYEYFYNIWIDYAADQSNSEIFSIVELGTDIGLSARMMRDRIVRHRGNEYYDITLVDTNFTKEAWAIVDNDNIFFIHRKAEDAVKFFEDQSIDVLHMDLAPHSYEQAKEIFKLYAPKLTKEGIMIWHDVGNSVRFSFEGRKFLNELRYPWCVSFCKEDSQMPDEAPAVIWRMD